jgi:glycosyltransferase involved in cell wall biosynthesis
MHNAANTVPDMVVNSNLMSEDTRVAWLFPMMLRTHYWQPVFREFTKLIPNSTVFVGQWGGFAEGYQGTFELRLVDGVRPIVLKNHQNGEQYHSAFQWVPLSIMKELASAKPDVIFTTGFSAWTVCALLYKMAKPVRVVVLWDGCSVYIQSQTSLLRRLQRRAMAPFIDFVVSNMREGTEYMQSALGMPSSKVLAHPFQVADPSILDSSSCPHDFVSYRRPRFLFVGSIDARKGWRSLVEATRRLVKQGIDQFSVLFVGAGKEEQELRAQIADGLDHVAHHVGPIAYHCMASVYRNADVFVFPTMDDVWGLVLVEAMTFGQPVICSKFAGAREMVAHAKNGFIVDPRDTEGFAASMAKFIENPSLIASFGAESLDLIAPFTPRQAAQVLADVALQSQPRKTNTLCAGSQPTVGVYS